jgi:siderophore synthetase component
VTPAACTIQALLNCLHREVSAPEGQAWEHGGHLMVRLARSGVLLRARLRRPSAGIGPRLAGQVQLRHGGTWRMIGWQCLAQLIAGELTLATGVPNEEFTAQVRAGHAAVAAILRARQLRARGAGGCGGAAGSPACMGDHHAGRYLASEQALITGHRFHPTPKARGGSPRDWLRYAPEARTRFPLRFLAVREEALAGDGDTTGLDQLGGPAPPPGYRALPAHPWQLRLLAGQPWLRRALHDGLIADLGPGARDVVPTSSVRTVYDPAADVFCKFSLNTRITNCVRRNSWYELAGAVVLTSLLAPVFAELAAQFPGTVLLGEPGYRTVALAGREGFEGLAVIVRDGLAGHVAPGVTPLLAASLTEPALPDAGATCSGPPGSAADGTQGLFDGRDASWLLGWWEAYLSKAVPPVLHAFFRHGVVLEPHLQNVLVGADREGLPAQVIFRDLEGVKLISPRHDGVLATLAPRVAQALAYDPERGWNRVAYCLLVNHLAEIAAAIADRCPGQAERFEAALWCRARRTLTEFARDHGWPAQLRATLAGVPLPAKANLRVRWARAGDREAGYVPVPNPLGEQEFAWDRETQAG